MKKQLLFLLVFCAALAAFYPVGGKVFFIPSIHGLHKINPNYSYDSLRHVIERLNPDVIAVELRPEDVDADSSYLKKNYPLEMRMMRYWFPKAKIAGFDWLGSDIEGRPIPDNYWRDHSPIKKYEKALEDDKPVSAKSGHCDALQQKRLALLKSLTLKQLLESEDAKLTRDFYDCFGAALKGSIHQRVPDFYDARNVRLLANIRQIISDNSGKRVIIITGDDHYVLLKDKFPHEKLFGN
jgi:hypothetical protein